MKTVIKPVLIVLITILGATFHGCGGTSGSGAGDNSTNVYDEGRTTNTLGELPFPSTNMAYEDIFENVDTGGYDILTLIGMEENLSTFAALAKMANLDMKINNLDAVTFFVPTNQAFEEMPLEQFNMLTDPSNRAQLNRFLQRHILPGKINAVDLNSSQVIETSSEEEITVDVEMVGELFYIGGAEVVKADINASNGVLHIVDAIVEPTRDVLPD